MCVGPSTPYLGRRLRPEGMGLQPKSLPEPNMQAPVNGPLIAYSSGFTWIGRSYSYQVKHLVGMIQDAVEHPGLSFLEVLQPCPTYNNLHDRDWFNANSEGEPRLYDLTEEGYQPDLPADMDETTLHKRVVEFIEKVHEAGDRIPIGLLLRRLGVTDLSERIATRVPEYRDIPPAKRQIADADGQSITGISAQLDELRVQG